MSPRKTTIAQGRLFTTPAVSRKARTVKKKVVSPSAAPQRIEPAPGKKRWLSATAVETSKRCPRCFWLQINCKIYHPEGIVSRLANRFDGVIKRYFDLYRGTADIPPMVAGQLEGRLESPFQETYFANLTPKYGFMGKLDECLVRDDGRFTPVDHKTASSDPTTRELIPAYQFQLDSYAFLLEQNRKPSSGIGYLIYFYPDEGKELHNGFPMQVTVKTLQTNPGRVKGELLKAIDILDGDLPAANPECPFCTYVQAVKDF